MFKQVKFNCAERQDSTHSTDDLTPEQIAQAAANARNRSNSVWDILTPDTWKDFMNVFNDLVQDLTNPEGMEDIAEIHEWLKKILYYNVPFGKRLRGLSTALAYKHMCGEEYTIENARLAKILGWCVEIYQASLLMADDIMDRSEMRRGKPCWYKVDNLGPAALNDAFLLESSCFMIIKKYFKGHPSYTELLDVFHDVLHKTYYGQSMDTRVVIERKFETFDMSMFRAIAKYKTAYETFYMPVALAIAFLGLEDPSLLKSVEALAVQIGIYYQVQNDYLDCFGEVGHAGKEGTDIQEGKCTWLFVKAMEKCSPDEEKFLLENYGFYDTVKVAAITDLYTKLGLPEEYELYEENVLKELNNEIEEMPDILPKSLFRDLITKIFLNGVDKLLPRSLVPPSEVEAAEEATITKLFIASEVAV